MSGRHRDAPGRALPDTLLVAVLDRLPSGVWVTDPDDTIVYANQALVRLAGIPRDRIVGASVLTGFPEGTLRDLRPLYQAAKRALEPRSYHLIPVVTPAGRATRQSGWLIPRVEDGAYAGMIATVEEAEDPAAAERAVRAWQERIQDFLRQAPFGYFRMDRSGRLTDVNEAWLRMYKYAGRDEVIGRHFADMQTDVDRAEAGRIVARLLSGEPIPGGEFSRRCKDGTIGYFTFTAMPVLEDGRVVGLEGFLIDTTARKQAEAEVRERELRLAKLASQVQGMLYQFQQRPDGTYCLPYTSEGIRGIFGVSPEAVRGDFAPVLMAIHPGDRDAVIRSIAQSAQDLAPWTCEFRVNLPDKGLRWMWGRSVPERLPDGGILWHGFATDVTERKQAETALASRERQFRSLFDHMAEGVALHEVIRDASGAAVNYRLLDTNPSYETQTGLPRARAVGSLATEVYGTKTPPYLEEFERVARTGKPHTFEVFFPPLARHFHISVVSPGPDQFATVFTDITERVALETSLRQARDAAESANRAKSAFLATMSHELRTPLNPIIGFSSLLMEDPGLTDLQRRHLSIVRRRSEDLLALLSDILDFSRLEADRCDLAPAEVNVRDLLADVMRSFASAAQEKGLWWEWHVAPETPDIIRTDPLRLKQVLLNLLGNALKFTVAGGVSLEVRPENDPAGRRLRLAVVDTGPGIPPELRGRLFEPFVHVGDPVLREHGGAGLGLPISQRLVTRLGGRLAVETAGGKGSTFVFTLPLEGPGMPGSPGKGPPPAGETDAGYAGLGLGRRALVVDDDPPSWMLASSLLERAGFTVECASSGSEALRRFEEGAFDLVLMDIRMPGLDGLDVTRRLRDLESASGRRTAVMAVTAYAMPGDRERILAAGMDAYVVKPVRQAEFFQTVASLLAAPREGGGAPAS